MCGIVAYSGSNPFNPDKIKILMMYNLSRGDHSTGMYNMGSIKKDNISADVFLEKNEIIPENMFIGHTRQATRGGRTAENAHPFLYEPIVGVHNGTINNVYSIVTENGLTNSDYDVDSQALIKLLGYLPEYNILKHIDGGTAVVFTRLDEVENNIYCFRNFERPLYKGKIPGEGMYISSMDGALKAIGCTAIKEFKVDNLYTIRDGETISYKRYNKIVKTYSNTYGYSESATEVRARKKKLFLKYPYVMCNKEMCGYPFKEGAYYEVSGIREPGTFYFDVLMENKDTGKMEEEKADLDYFNMPTEITNKSYLQCMSKNGNTIRYGQIVKFCGNLRKPRDGRNILVKTLTRSHGSLICDNGYYWNSRMFRALTELEFDSIKSLLINGDECIEVHDHDWALKMESEAKEKEKLKEDNKKNDNNNTNNNNDDSTPQESDMMVRDGITVDDDDPFQDDSDDDENKNISRMQKELGLEEHQVYVKLGLIPDTLEFTYEEIADIANNISAVGYILTADDAKSIHSRLTSVGENLIEQNIIIEEDVKEFCNIINGKQA